MKTRSTYELIPQKVLSYTYYECDTNTPKFFVSLKIINLPIVTQIPQTYPKLIVMRHIYPDGIEIEDIYVTHILVLDFFRVTKKIGGS